MIVCTAFVGYSVTEISVGYFAIASVPSDKYFCWPLCDNINSQSHKFWLGTLCWANGNFRWLLCDSIIATLWKHQCPLKEISIGYFVTAPVPTEGNFCWLLSQHQCPMMEICTGLFATAWWKSLLAAFCYFWLGGLIDSQQMHGRKKKKKSPCYNMPNNLFVTWIFNPVFLPELRQSSALAALPPSPWEISWHQWVN